jgi:hypothetical protein
LIKQANEIVKCLADNGLEFEPEELSAVEKWKSFVELQPLQQAYTGEEIIEIVKKGNTMRDELKAEIEGLKKELETPHEDKAIESESRMIGKKPYVESPELIAARDDYNSIPHAESSIEYQYVLNLERALKELIA